MRTEPKRFTGQTPNGSDHPWIILSPWNEDIIVNRARASHYVVVWNALGKGRDVISSLSSAGMFL